MQLPINIRSISAAILAGGRSSRMGRDKAFLPSPPDGATLIARQAALLRSLGIDDLLISGRAEVDYGLPEACVVLDAVPDAGPLAGLAALLNAARRPWVLVIAVDLPHLTSTYLGKILNAGNGCRGVVPHGPNGYEPLVALYPQSLLTEFESALAAGRRSLQPLIQTAVAAGNLQAIPIEADEHVLFTNWNTPTDVRNA
jgi:molybdenum cofactor guanylyltransferase